MSAMSEASDGAEGVADVESAGYRRTMAGGRYVVDSLLGEGTGGEVFAAQDTLLERPVAIKRLPPPPAHSPRPRDASNKTEAEAAARLLLEARAVARLSHPNIVTCYDVFEEDGLLHLVLEQVPGGTLRQRLDDRGPLPVDDLTRLGIELASALAHAHAHGIVHRDLKPENIMLCRSEDGAERAVVLDFGLAKERRVSPELAKLTNSGIVLGTPEFMSPEQLRCKPLDARSDIYSLGLITCEMLTGGLPFAGRTQQDVMVARLRGDPIPIRQMRPDLDFPAAVERVLLTSLRRDPEERYHTAPAFAAALAAAAARGSRDVGLLSRLRWR